MTTFDPTHRIHPAYPEPPKAPKISFFRAPVTNTHPHSIATLRQIYNAIRGDYYKDRTQHLRHLFHNPLAPGEDPRERLQQCRKFKASNFDYCTFSGAFTTRSDKALIKHSNLICFDFDNILDPQELRFKLTQDHHLTTQLIFISPTGHGVKWIVATENFYGDIKTAHANYFATIATHIQQTYNIEVDKSGKDLSRACFLPHDPAVYINPIYLQ